MRFSLPSFKCSGDPPSFRLSCLNCTQRFDLVTARSAVVVRLGGTADHLIDGCEKRICRLSFEFESPHVIEKRSNTFLEIQVQKMVS